MLQIHLFGHLRLLVNQQSHRFATLPKTAPLLAYLLLHRDTAVPRDHLAFLLWDDVPENEARANLRRHLHDLRRALPPKSDQPWVISDGKTLQWNPAAPWWLDVAAFEQLCQDTTRLAEAITLYTGDLLTDLYEDWLAAERERLRTLYFATISGLITREQARGDLAQAIVYARQLLNHDPLREDVVRNLIVMRHESGDRAGAMQLYQQFKERLAEELGVAPMPETTTVYEAITANQPLLSYHHNQRPPTPSPLQPTFTSPVTTPSPPHNLPAQLTSFVGRHEELTQVCQLIGTAATRLLTITGPGGTGKTRLALAAAHWLWQHQPDQFPDGVFFVGLSAVTNPGHVATAVAETVGAWETADRPLSDSLKEHLHTKQLLLLIDNFEHLLAAAPLVSDLLTAVPGLRILVTSQANLHLYGETEFPLAPLSLPDLNNLPPITGLMQYTAIALFVERLRAVYLGFTLTPENAHTVVEICACLDGMPLALELAAARGKLFTPVAMLAQLNNRLRFLNSQARNLPARHQTLRATIDWSYYLLEPAEQQMFGRLSLFVSSFTAEAALAVCPDIMAGETAVLDVISSLTDKNMIRFYLPGNGAPRFRLLQTLREYALEKLAQTPAEADTRYRYAAYYTTLTEQAEAGLRQGDQQSWLQRMRLEDPNVMAALEWLYAHLDDPENGRLATRLITAHERFWSLQGRFREARLWFARALTCRHLLPLAEQVKLLNKAGVIAQHQGDYTAAAVLHDEALTLARQEEDTELLANTLHYLGFAAGRQGRYEEARDLLHESLSLSQELPDTLPQITTLLNNLAIVYRRLKAYDQAIVALEKALALKRQLNDRLGLPAVLGNLSQLVAFQGDYVQARAYAQESLELRLASQDRPGMLVSLGQMADLALETGQDARATTLLAASLALRQHMSLPMTDHVQAETDAELAQLRLRLSEATYAAAWAAGEGMTLEEAVTFALAKPNPAGGL